MSQEDTDLELAPSTGGVTLVFSLSGETFGIEVARVHEIIDPLSVTRVPNADPFAPGLINVRGSVVPAVDMHYRLGFRANETTSETRLLVIETAISGETTKLAMIADGVKEIVDLEAREIEPVPSLGTRWPAEYVSGIAKRGGELFVLLNAVSIFDPDPNGVTTTTAD